MCYQNVLPKYDTKNKTFVEPYLPNNKIGIMHLAAGLWKNDKDMRTNKDVEIDIFNWINITSNFGTQGHYFTIKRESNIYKYKKKKFTFH